MGHFFGSIYCWFEDLFGIELANYLWGITSSNNNLFVGIGLWMIFVSLMFAILYYYIVDHPRLHVWWGWAIFLTLNSIVNFIIGWQWVLSDLYAGKMKTIDPITNLEMNLPINESDCIYFGVSNMILSILFFFIISMIIKWKSVNCSYSPF